MSEANPYTFIDNPTESGVAICDTDILNDDIMCLKWMHDHISFRNIGEIVQSTIPLTDAGLHLLDGTLISGSGSYADFVDYMAELYDEGEEPPVYESWTQPTLSENGTMGGNTAACASSSTYGGGDNAKEAFDGNSGSYWSPNNFDISASSPEWITFYNPDALKVSQVVLTFPTANHAYSSGEIQGSNDNSTWTTLASFSGNSSASLTISVTTSNAYKYIRLYITGTRGSGTNGGLTQFDITATKYAGTVVQAPPYFCTEADWQTAVSTYGVCGKFVYDGVNNTVRLPKTTSEHGTLIKSYSSGSDWYRLYSDGWCEQGGQFINVATNAGTDVNFIIEMVDTNYDISLVSVTNTSYDGGITNNYRNLTTTGMNITSSHNAGSSSYWDAATVRWSICGYANLPSEVPERVYEYIVVATSTKTDIQVDIDEIATDLNGKMDSDLSNMSASSSAKSTIIRWGLPDYTAGITISTGSYTPPKDGLIRISGGNNGTGKYIDVNGARAVQAWVNSTTSTDIIAFVQKSDTVSITGNGVDVYFYPLKGAV